jgi:hypothetical protein
MSAAYLSFQETYYLRRLTSRPGHDSGCPFHLPQAPPRIRETVKDSLYAIGLPKGLFSAHQKAPEKLAQRPEDIEPDDRSRGVAIPRLGKLLWLLLERAGSNILRELPPSGRRAGSISEEMHHLKRAAQGLDIAPGIRLSDHLSTPRAARSRHCAIRRTRSFPCPRLCDRNEWAEICPPNTLRSP